jgi:MYXO-CTERM domain-containing protein
MWCSTARAALVFNFAQVGNDVIATGSGSANLSGLTFRLSLGGSQINVDAGSGNFRGGATGVSYLVYETVTIPPTGYGFNSVGFGPGTGTNNIPSSSSGDYFGLTAFNGRLFLPDAYVSETPLSNTTTWNNRTLANLGLAPAGSSFTYSWGSGLNADSLTINIIPEPSSAVAATVALTGLAAIRRRRRVVAAGAKCGLIGG